LVIGTNSSYKDDHHKTNWEEQCPDSPYQTGSIGLKPRRSFCTKSYGAAVAMQESVLSSCGTMNHCQTVDLPETKQRTSHERIEEQLVKPHVSFFASNSRHQLNRLLRRKGIHDCSN